MDKNPLITGWGNYPKLNGELFCAKDIKSLEQHVRQNPTSIARGNGRSYGDSSCGKKMASMLEMNRIVDLDEENLTVQCEAGLLLSDLLHHIIPMGLFLPVMPGTKFITIGGAIAADVHGKNHFAKGSFSNHLVSIELMIANGEIIHCSPDENQELFWNTCGGMGLTGVIVSARLSLRRISTTVFDQVTVRVNTLKELLREFEKLDGQEFAVAWVDGFSKNLRSVFQIGNHIESERKQPLQLKDTSKPIPGLFANLLNDASIKVFNEWTYWKPRPKVVPMNLFCFPLDAVSNWNVLYGKNGFLQYQFVLPKDCAEKGMLDIVELLRNSGNTPYLVTLKMLGPKNSSPLSFPMEGFTMALDLEVNNKLLGILEQADKIVFENGGRIYLAKDARMNANSFSKMYSGKDSIKPAGQDNSTKFSSYQSDRLGLTNV